MLKMIKWFFIIVFVLVILAAATAAVAINKLDPNEFKPQIEAQVEKSTGREFKLNGDIGWSIFPILGLTLDDAQLANAKGFSDEPFAKLAKISVKVALLPLLKMQVEAEKIIIDGADLNLEKNAAGADNWSSLSQQNTDTIEPSEKTDSDTAESSLPPLEIRIKGLQLSNSRISYSDAQTKTNITVNPLNLETGSIELGQPISIKADANILQDEMAALIMLDGRIHYDLDTGRYSTDNLKLSQQLSGAGFPTDGIELSQILTVKADVPAETISIPKLSLKALGIELDGALNITQFSSNPAFNGQLSSNDFSPKALLEALESPLEARASAGALSSASLSFTLAGTADQITLSDLQAKLDASTLSGQLQIVDVSTQAVRFDLTLDTINLDDYMAAESNTSPVASDGVSAAAESSEEIVLPVEALKALNVDGTAKIQKLIVKELQFDDASVRLKAKAGKLEISPLSANAYSGSATITASLNVTGLQPTYSADVKLDNVRSEEILQVLFDDKFISGAANFTAAIATTGNNTTGLTKNLTGKYQTSFTDGTIQGSKLAGKITDARNGLLQLQGKSSLTEEQAVGTEFSELSASGTIAAGIVFNKDLRIISPVFQAKGQGEVSLPKTRINYTLSVADNGAESRNVVYVPLQVIGPFDDLSFRLRLDDLIKQKAKAALEAEKAKLKAKLKAKMAVQEAQLRAKADVEKAKLQEKLVAEQARAQAKIDEKKAELQQKLDKEKSRLEEKLKNELGNSLKGLFN